jgi:hypothetical protein
MNGYVSLRLFRMQRPVTDAQLRLLVGRRPRGAPGVITKAWVDDGWLYAQFYVEPGLDGVLRTYPVARDGSASLDDLNAAVKAAVSAQDGPKGSGEGNDPTRPFRQPTGAFFPEDVVKHSMRHFPHYY